MVHLIVTVIALTVLSSTDAYPASSRQLLPPKPGYVPVYIRNGDTPLEDINLELAEAFHAIPSGRSAGRNDIMAQRSNNEENVVQNIKEEPAPEIKVEKEDSEINAEEIEDEIKEVKKFDGEKIHDDPNEVSKKENKVDDSKSRKIDSENVSEHIQKIAKTNKQ